MTTSTLGTLARRGSAVGDAVRAGSSDLRHAAALLAADTLACMVIGGKHRTVQRLLISQDTVFGPEAQFPLAVTAAVRHFADALAVDVTAAHVDEFDAVHPISGTVPGAVVVPLALRLGARMDLSGPEFLAAIAAGYEVTAAAALAIGGSQLYQRSWWPGSVAGRLGAAMTAARILGLDHERTRQALSLAAVSVGGLLTQDIFADGHYAGLGDAAALGAAAARRAAAGMRASATLFDGPAGRAFRLEPAVVDRTPLILSGLHKEFPCATPLQAVIRGLGVAGGAAAIRTSSAVEIAVPAGMLAYLSAERIVDGPPEAAASIAYAVGAVLDGRERDVTYFRDADQATTFPGRLSLTAGDDQEAVEIRLVCGDGPPLCHRELLRPDDRATTDQDHIVTRKLESHFGTGSLPMDLLAGLTPRDTFPVVRTWRSLCATGSPAPSGSSHRATVGDGHRYSPPRAPRPAMSTTSSPRKGINDER